VDHEVYGDIVNAEQEPEASLEPTKLGMADFILNQIDDADINKDKAEDINKDKAKK